MQLLDGSHMWSSAPIEGARFPDGYLDGDGMTCPYGVPGDRLWVKETWGKSLHSEGYDENGYEVVRICPAYKADGMYRCGKPANPEIPWWSPIFMPRWASRLTLEVTGVRVERLQKISEADAKAEGVQLSCGQSEKNDYPNYKRSFHQLWDKLNAQRGYPWASNPWVWIVEFRKAGEE